VRPSRTLRLACSAALALTAAPAFAQERGAGAVYDRSTFPYGEEVNQPLTLPATLIRIDVPIVANASTNRVGEPVFVPLALDYGVTNDVQIGIIHARGLCLSGTSSGCREVYDDFGARMVVGLSRTPEAHLALEVDVYALDLDDVTYDAAAALRYKRSLGIIGVTFDAGVVSILNDRGSAQFTEIVFGDAEGAVDLGASLSAFGRIGVNRRLGNDSGYDAHLDVPVAFGVELAPMRKLEIGVELDFPNLLGENATADERELVVLLRLFV
jgi:hypothetical protein